MTQAAVPKGVAEAAGNFSEAAPGHRFNLYFPIWRDDWSADNNHKKDAIKDCTRIPPRVAEVLDGIRTRQQALFATYPEGLRIEAVSTAPFATGLGNEHPVENGFAFLTPYGLPYLAGSGVKGVLRRAAEELALFPGEYGVAAQAAPTLLDVWWLFGFEGAAGAWWPLTSKEREKLPEDAKQRRAQIRSSFQAHLATLAARPDLPAWIRRALPPGKDRARYLDHPGLFLEGIDDLRQRIHTRGALTFWDVFPRPPRQGPFKDRLAVEIMTPHYSDYYQRKVSSLYPDGATPHDSGQPNPIPFLAVPSESSFDFHVICEPHFLPDAPRPTWKTLLRSIFDHAFEWMGFGAKTTVGYGVVQPDPVAEEARRHREAQEAARRAQDLAERRRQEAEAAEAAQAKAAFETMPESDRALERLRQGLAVFGGSGQLDKDRYAELAGLLNGLAAEAQGWAGAADRNRAADAIAAACERFGWSPLGLKRDKRERKERERREQIEQVRAGGASPADRR
jgi:CRISPR-associated protein Cmr6